MARVGRNRKPELGSRLPPPADRMVLAPEHFMALAVAEAKRGLGLSSPNPSVGAVLVKAGEIVGLGHTREPGGPHAEIVALRAAGPRSRGADLYSTLEPCNHFGRTPPCTEAILNAGVARVFVGARDPNPHVAGGGAARLRRAGVPATEGVLGKACEDLHAAFFKLITTGLPFVTLKVASTLDGRMATSAGHSKWVTGEAARRRVHEMRAQVDAVMVGAGTALADDPTLTARHVNALRQPTRVVVEGARPLPGRLAMFRDGQARTLLATARTRKAPRGVEIIHCRPGPLGVDLGDLLRQLGELGVGHLLVEGGGRLGSALLSAGQVDALSLFLAPRMLGAGLAWFVGPPTRRMDHALPLRDFQVESIGDDLLITGRLGVAKSPGRRRNL